MYTLKKFKLDFVRLLSGLLSGDTASFGGHNTYIFLSNDNSYSVPQNSRIRIPVITLFLSYHVLNEPVSLLMLIMCGCIMVGTYQAQKQAKL